MQIVNMYVIYDSKAELYNRPMGFLNHAIALRAATELRDDLTTEVGRHPQDFTMFHIGTYDDSTATFTPLKANTVVVRFHEIPQSTPETDEPLFKEENTTETGIHSILEKTGE